MTFADGLRAAAEICESYMTPLNKRAYDILSVVVNAIRDKERLATIRAAIPPAEGRGEGAPERQLLREAQKWLVEQHGGYPQAGAHKDSETYRLREFLSRIDALLASAPQEQDVTVEPVAWMFTNKEGDDDFGNNRTAMLTKHYKGDQVVPLWQFGAVAEAIARRFDSEHAEYWSPQIAEKIRSFAAAPAAPVKGADELRDAVSWILEDAAYKAPELIGDVAMRWIVRLNAALREKP